MPKLPRRTEVLGAFSRRAGPERFANGNRLSIPSPRYAAPSPAASASTLKCIIGDHGGLLSSPALDWFLARRAAEERASPIAACQLLASLTNACRAAPPSSGLALTLGSSLTRPSVRSTVGTEATCLRSSARHRLIPSTVPPRLEPNLRASHCRVVRIMTGWEHRSVRAESAPCAGRSRPRSARTPSARVRLRPLDEVADWRTTGAHCPLEILMTARETADREAVSRGMAR